jgi:hypothetical protein
MNTVRAGPVNEIPNTKFQINSKIKSLKLQTLGGATFRFEHWGLFGIFAFAAWNFFANKTKTRPFVIQMDTG